MEHAFNEVDPKKETILSSDLTEVLHDRRVHCAGLKYFILLPLHHLKAMCPKGERNILYNNDKHYLSYTKVLTNLILYPIHIDVVCYICFLTLSKIN